MYVSINLSDLRQGIAGAPPLEEASSARTRRQSST